MVDSVIFRAALGGAVDATEAETGGGDRDAIGTIELGFARDAKEYDSRESEE